MAACAADGVRGGGAVDADAGAVEAGPEDADRVVGAGGEVVEVIGAFAALEDAEIVAEPWEGDCAGDAPFAFWCGVFGGAGGDGEGGDEAGALMDAENFLTEIDGDAAGLGGG